MLSWIVANLGTILVGGLVAIVLAAIVAGMRKSKREGKSSCGCGSGCSGCAMGGSCHTKS